MTYGGDVAGLEAAKHPRRIGPPTLTDDLYMTDQLFPYDPADSLTTAEAIADFLTDAEQTEDAAYIAQAQAVAERARDRLTKCHHDEDR